MARAMRDAEEEDSDLDDLDEEEGSAFESFAGEDVGMDAGIAEGEDDEEMSEEDEDEDELEDEADEEEADEDEEMLSDSEEDEEDAYTKPSGQKHNYLPDHLFKSALTSARNTKITFANEEPAPSRARASPPQKRRRAKRSEKDVVLGYVYHALSSVHSSHLCPIVARALSARYHGPLKPSPPLPLKASPHHDE